MNEDYIANAAVLLSMDIVDPLLPLIGLHQVDAQLFRERIRSGLRVGRQIVGEARLSTGSVTGKPLSVILAENLGQEYNISFRDWANAYYQEDPADHRPLLVWRGIMNTICSQINRKQLICSYSLLRSLMDFCQNLKASGEFDDLWQCASESQLSQWDIDLLALGVWDDEETYGLDALYYRLHTIYLCVSELNAWKAYLTKLSEMDLNELHSVGKKIVSKSDSHVASLCSPLQIVGFEK